MRPVKLNILGACKPFILATILFSMCAVSCKSTTKANNEKNKTAESLEVVKGFFEAINSGDMQKAASYMADNHHYTGPMFSTNNPEDYFKALGKFEMEFAVETQDLIGYEGSVTHISILKVLSPVQATIPCCEVFDIENGKIVRQRFYFDTALFPSP